MKKIGGGLLPIFFTYPDKGKVVKSVEFLKIDFNFLIIIIKFVL